MSYQPKRLAERAKQFLLERPRLFLPIWSLVALLASLAKLKPARHNNFTIFRTSWQHFAEQSSLYAYYPEQYNDRYLYGPSFAVLIAPLAILPEPLSFLLWQMLLALMLFVAIARLDLSLEKKLFVGAFSLNELVTALMMQQWNIGIGALVILAFAMCEQRKEHWATLFIALGIVTKIYGIVGLAFFPFVQNKWRFTWSLGLWLAFLLALPMAVGGVDYTLGQYQEWFVTLGDKNGQNLFATMQNISLLGIIRKWTGLATYPDLIPIAIGLVLYGLPFLRFGQYRHAGFRFGILASTLMFVVLFSTGSESSSYIIAFPAIALWYLLSEHRTGWDLALLIGAFVLSSLSPTDIFPRFIREQWVLPYALKALFPSLIWIKLSLELLLRDYATIRLNTPRL